MTTSFLVAVAVLAPLVGSASALARPRLQTAGSAMTAALAVATAASLALVVSSGLATGGELDAIGWLDASLGRASAVLLAIVTGTATVVAGFSRRSLEDDGRAGRYFALIGIVTAGSAMVIVPAWPGLLVLGWVASGWALVGLVGFEASWAPAANAQRRIRRTLAIGDVALLAAVLVAARNADGLFTGEPTATDELAAATIGGLSALDLTMVLAVVAGASRSALFPFHRWLIGTLAAPTPVSALVHAGLVSGAGLLLLRLADPFTASDSAVILAFSVAIATVVIASAASALRSDVKGGLAWSTVAQMAFMVVQCSVGAFSSAVFHIAGHGMYKASLFLGSGDTAASGLRARRSPEGLAHMEPPMRWIVAAVVALLAVGVAGLIVPPDVSPAGEMLVFVFAWSTVAFGTDAWLRRAPFQQKATLASAGLGAAVSALTYFGGLRLMEAFVKPSLLGTETVIGPTTLGVTLAVIALIVTAVALLPGAAGDALRDRAQRLVVMTAETDRLAKPPADANQDLPQPFLTAPAPTGVRRAEILADVATAGRVIAPQWPLASFVAVNPLGDLETLDFDDATREARRWLGARTHLTLEDYRHGHQQGLSSAADLRHAAYSRFAEICSRGPVLVAGREVDPVEIIIADLLHGPDEIGGQSRSEGDLEWSAALVDSTLSAWLTAYVDPPRWAVRRRGETFVAMSRRLALTDPRIAGLVSEPARAWIRDLGDDPASVIDAAFAAAGVADEHRVEAARRHLCRLPGWSGLAKWRNQWAHPDETRPPLAPVDLIASRALIEVAINGPAGHRSKRETSSITLGEAGDTPSLDARIDAVARALAAGDDHGDRAAIGGVLADVPADARVSVWLDAEERAVDGRLLSMLDRLDPGKRTERPDAQLVFCIDVRSEGLRREIEDLANIETIGFAGFFGVPMRIRRLGWTHPEPRCPVLVSPAIQATEHARTDAIGAIAQRLTRQRCAAGIRAAHSSAKSGPGAPFALAETAGWLLGPLAAARTFLPRRTAEPVTAPTRMILDDDEVLLEQRIFFAESVLNTMGLTDRFAPIVALCGHTSVTTNNPHATALECGACAGAAGDDNARAVAALLNSPDVRHGLTERGITIPDDTWFLPGLHDTVSDRVTFLDRADAPASHQSAIVDLERTLEQAGRAQAATRAHHLPGPADRVAARGQDWAQVRPEWGLARNAAFIIGPRSMTEGLDLDGRAFLHSYEADNDPTGKVLETIMTAPLIVGHWISSQYYFSTVDSETFGAGNKLLHNPIGTTGVVSGNGGDLRVGLPQQSTQIDGRPFHQPVRLLAVIQADLNQVERIIAKNPILQTLTRGSWIRIAARSQPHERWSTRTPAGTWIETPRDFDPDLSLTINTEIS